MNQTIEKTADIQAKPVPMNVALESIMEDIDAAMEALWRLQAYDLPEDAAQDVIERVLQWQAGFTELCRCGRPGRYCICP